MVVAGLLLELFCVVLARPLAHNTANIDPVRRSWLLSWVPVVHHWHMFVPAQVWDKVPWLLPVTAEGRVNLLLVALGAAVLCLLFAWLSGIRIGRVPLELGRGRPAFWIMLVFTAIFALTVFCSPISLDAFSLDMLSSALYGRMVVIYHVNPYTVAPEIFAADPVQILRASILHTSNPLPATSYGPVLTDINILVALAARGSVDGTLLGFRVLGALAHLCSVVVLWQILAQMQPQRRVSLTLLYAWNPFVLLFGIVQAHPQMIVILFVLLAIYFFQRNAPILTWFFVLLAAMVDLSCLLILPLFLRIIVHQTRFLWWFWRFCWWLGLLAVTALSVALAYAPYWQGWGIAGLWSSLRVQFWQDTAVNSLDAALLHLPIHFPQEVMWLLQPDHWMVLALVAVAIFLFFALWLADTLELALVCCGGVLLLFVTLQPQYWPWYTLFPLAIAFSSRSRGAAMLAFLLLLGTLLHIYLWQLNLVWPGEGLITIAVPCVLWGWGVFLVTAWRKLFGRAVTRSETRPMPLARPPWFSRPSQWNSRPGRGDL